MQKLLLCFVAVMLFFTYAEKSHASIGIPDHVPAATLIIPFFEVGIDSVANPQDTLPVITNVCNSPLTVHYETWDIGGGPVSLLNTANTVWGHIALAARETKSLSMRALVNGANTATKAQLTVGPFYRGFVTFDVVTSGTDFLPTSASYPFSSSNCLTGQIYYTRLSQGSSNGLPMVPLEATPPGTFVLMKGFYSASDDREQIDGDARYANEQLTRGEPAAEDPSGSIDSISSRLYLEPVNNGTSRVIVFAFNRGHTCTNCGPGTVAFARRNGAGTVVDSGNYNLNNYVNVLDISGSESGWLNISFLDAANWGVYAFSFNSASPPGAPELTWDAIFESFIFP